MTNNKNYMHTYYLEHKDHLRKIKREYYLKHLDEFKQRNKDKFKRLNKKWGGK